MKPGDLVRIWCGHSGDAATSSLLGELGVIVNVRRGKGTGARIAEVLVDGNIRHFYFDYLELVDEAR